MTRRLLPIELLLLFDLRARDAWVLRQIGVGRLVLPRRSCLLLWSIGA